MLGKMLRCDSAKTVQLQYHAMWKVDVRTGEVTFPAATKRYEAVDAKISGRGRCLCTPGDAVKLRASSGEATLKPD